MTHSVLLCKAAYSLNLKEIEGSKVCDTSIKGVVDMTHVLLLLPSMASPD